MIADDGEIELDNRAEDRDDRPDLTRGAPRTVLVVDDEPDIVDEMVDILEGEGFVCLSAASGSDAVALLRGRPDVGIVVSDIRMPGMGGLRMAEEITALCELGRDVSVIMVTGHAGMAEAIRALKIGVDDFLTKPLSPEQLVHSVTRSSELVQLRWQDRAFTVALEAEVAERTSEVRRLMAEVEEKNRDLAHANAAKDEFLDMISHEVNTPLNAILGFGQLLREDAAVANDREAVQSVDEILSAGRHLHRKLHAILTMASARRGDETLLVRPFFADDVLAVVADMVRRDAVARRITVRTEVPGGPIEAVADLGRLTQAVQHLAENAVRHSPDGGCVTIRADVSEDGMLTIAVADDGSGMSADELAAALEPLRRGKGVAGDVQGGVGLGLPLARLFAEMHGGSLTVETEPGAGTTAVLSVPRRARD